ncbi:hypothetical protein PFICI_08430 [Pestalotiopsis fici W106-1]|uniref:EKC/KEOPS complex subunit GON7 n=1 Tax=Pestalotiopsis fici (strain W106-1 / CGMCC3.15140) TaxID=1229662 RepID=W3X6U0_PESFW|nr:uncharacterized protein PFICI_08430 [Pestalotiopsis fici W106-1]ETS80901.1 hypothetical protein PFICI_08430 [Pestalotiopsis fici W106-1]
MTSADESKPVQPALQAQYTNASTTLPAEPFTLTQTLPAIPSSSSSSEPPSAYLRALRDAVTQTQSQINEALTSRMEDDKRREAEAALAAGQGTGAGAKNNKRKKGKTEIDEEAEEQNYGEEVVDED